MFQAVNNIKTKVIITFSINPIIFINKVLTEKWQSFIIFNIQCL